MYVNKEDKNIFIMVLAIFAVSIIALIAIGNIIWRIISPGVNTVVAEVSNLIRVNRLDYNFPIPPKKEPIVQSTNPDALTVEQQKVLDMNLNYNFAFSTENKNLIVSGVENFFEEINDDYKLGPTRQTGEVKENYLIRIPKISLNSPVYRDNKAESLKFGIMQHKSSYNLGEGEVTVLCLRRHFNNNDPRSCYFMDLLNLNDEIYLKDGEEEVRYKVTKLEFINNNYENIYNSITDNKDTIKIVTSGAIDSGKGRLVVTAQRS